jgi:hypothetical protein
MTPPRPRVHHVVFCVHRANQDDAASFCRDLGFEFAEFELDDVGLRVLLDWDGGMEIISPMDAAGPEAQAARTFLEERGEGVYSVVVRTPDVDGPRSMAVRAGAVVEFEQHRQGTGFWLDEVQLSPVHGVAVTLLATDLP